jgi:RHS repeat-associated protein
VVVRYFWPSHRRKYTAAAWVRFGKQVASLSHWLHPAQHAAPPAVIAAGGAAPFSAASGNAKRFAYDEENRLVSVSTIDDTLLHEYLYDALGRRILTHDHTPATAVQTRHVYGAGFEVLAEYESSDNWETEDLAREFLWGERFPEPLVLIDWTAAGDVAAESEEVLHYLHDHLGSVIALVDAGDPNATPTPIPPKVVERYTYDPYGTTYIETWNGSGFDEVEASAYGNPFAWTAQRYDAGVGLYAFPFRGYSPALGRFLQRDPLGYIDGPNLYEYVSSMPTTATDPLGLAVLADKGPGGSGPSPGETDGEEPGGNGDSDGDGSDDDGKPDPCGADGGGGRTGPLTAKDKDLLRELLNDPDLPEEYKNAFKWLLRNADASDACEKLNEWLERYYAQMGGKIIRIQTNRSGGADKDGGHAWIEIEDRNTGKRHRYGLWPDFNERTDDNGPGHDIRIDLEGDVNPISREHELTPEEEEAFWRKVREDKTWRPTYNCVSWAVECWAEVTGEKLNGKDKELFGVHTPRALGASILKENGELAPAPQGNGNSTGKEDGNEDSSAQ